MIRDEFEKIPMGSGQLNNSEFGVDEEHLTQMAIADAIYQVADRIAQLDDTLLAIHKELELSRIKGRTI